MNKQRSLLLNSLAHIISDYRQNEIEPITDSHVNKWLCQFDDVDQPVILSEINHIMKKLYLPKAYFKSCVLGFIKKYLIREQNPREALSHINFLCLGGRSQNALLDLVAEILLEEYGMTAEHIGTSNVRTYVYMDDAIYTGNKLRYDLTDGQDAAGWISTCPPNCSLLIYSVIAHREGTKYAKKHIEEATLKKRITFKIITSLIIEDSRDPSNEALRVLWPEYINGPLVNEYASNLYTPFGRKLSNGQIFRNSSIISDEQLFSSLQARRVVERAFLLKGVELVQASQNPSPSMRPLGYMKLASLGFGTMCVSYRNIANNCPLVLWWGDPTLPSGHPLSIWYPLFPRKTNSML